MDRLSSILFVFLVVLIFSSPSFESRELLSVEMKKSVIPSDPLKRPSYDEGHYVKSIANSDQILRSVPSPGIGHGMLRSVPSPGIGNEMLRSVPSQGIGHD